MMYSFTRGAKILSLLLTPVISGCLKSHTQTASFQTISCAFQ